MRARKRTRTRWWKFALKAAGVWGIWRLDRYLRGARGLRGSVVLITGASRGLGLELAWQFAAAGAKLAITARDENELREACEELQCEGVEVFAKRCDVADRDQVEALVEAVIERFGRIDVVVNNAGIIQVGPVESMTVENFARALAVNFWGPLFVTEAAVKHMRIRRAGRIVNIGSIGGGTAPVPHLLPFDCAKAALVSLSEGMGAELRKDGITVTTVIPGLMRTGSAPYAFYKGNARQEYALFRKLGTSRITAMAPARAAKRIVAATARGDRELSLSLQTKLLRIAHGLLPGALVRLFEALNGVLPDDNQGERFRQTRGFEIERELRREALIARLPKRNTIATSTNHRPTLPPPRG
jgi:NAD(P)-dependent dehydrogenase (short-subunit alcohol dehydrogenase family)